MKSEEVEFMDQLAPLQVFIHHEDGRVFRDNENVPVLFNIKLGDSNNEHSRSRYQALRLPETHTDSESETEVYIPDFTDLKDFTENFLNVYFLQDSTGKYNDRSLNRLYNYTISKDNTDQYKIDEIFFGLIDIEKDRIRDNVISNMKKERIFSPISQEQDRRTFDEYIARRGPSHISRNTGPSPPFISLSYGYDSAGDKSSPKGGGNKKRKWSARYKRSINCKRPRGFSQKQYCKYGCNKNTRRKHLKKKKGTKKGRGTPSRKNKSKKTNRRHK
jgi:hypothetical protein